MNSLALSILTLALSLDLPIWAQTPVQYQEKADILYRDLSASVFGVTDMHPAIYVRYMDEVAGAHPDDPAFHRLIEMAGPAGVRILTKAIFFQDGQYRGARTPRQSLDNPQRDQIVDLAFSLQGFPYVGTYSDAYFRMLIWNRDPPIGNGDNILDEVEIGGLRSDAWVEYVFARANPRVLLQNDIIRNTQFYLETCIANWPNPGGSCLVPSDQHAATDPSLYLNPLVEVKENIVLLGLQCNLPPC